MSILPSIDGKKLIKLLGKSGFETVRIKGSHHFLRHRDGRATVVPVHRKEDIGTGLLHKILRDCEMTNDDFLSLINQ